MKTDFRKSFGRDLDKLKHDRSMLRRIRAAIEEVESAKDLRDVKN